MNALYYEAGITYGVIIHRIISSLSTINFFPGFFGGLRLFDGFLLGNSEGFLLVIVEGFFLGFALAFVMVSGSSMASCSAFGMVSLMVSCSALGMASYLASSMVSYLVFWDGFFDGFLLGFRDVFFDGLLLGLGRASSMES